MSVSAGRYHVLFYGCRYFLYVCIKIETMKVISTIRELRQSIENSNLKPVGLVPTMGALHEGHLSLVRIALDDCRLIVVTIFVNPAQFNDKNDLKNYPRTLEEDLRMLGTVLRQDDIVFTPEITEMYPEEDTRQFSFGNLDRVMEAPNRPGHFNGVARIVSKLFTIADPDRAYFGLKDFQQVAVIKELARQMKSRIEIISCPIVRESDGLAMSSRNSLLEPEIRKNAPVIFRTISRAAEMLKKEDVANVRRFVSDEINNTPDFKVEYFEIVDDAELVPVKKKEEMILGRQYYGCIAVKAGNIRLIDNILVKSA
jgi:pantoate--beta-alanine ligase